MADVTEDDANAQVEAVEASEFQKYLASNPELGKEMMKIIVHLYNNPMKQTQVQPCIHQMFDIEKKDASLADQLRQENFGLQNENFDLQDKVLALEKEYEEIKEEDI